jgi:hypothetical protein
MTRQEFLKSLWTRFFRPILIIGALVFLVRFFFHALDSGSEERQFINLIGFGFVIGGLLISVGFLLVYVLKLVAENTPDRVKRFFAENAKRIAMAVNVSIVIVILYFAIKFIVDKDYGNLMGLLVVVGITGLKEIFRRQE